MKLGFRSKIYLGIFSPLLLLGVVILFVVTMIMKDALLEENRNRGISIGINLAARVAEPVLAMDFFRMKALVDKTIELSDDIYYAFVLDAKGEPLVHTFEGGFPVDLKAANVVSGKQDYNIRLLDTGSDLIYDYAVPVHIANDRLGTVRLGLLRTRVEEAINRVVWSVFLSTGLVILIAGFVGTVLARPVTRRIKILHESSEQAMRGNLDVQTAQMLKKNCWEINNCDKQDCPAYGDLHHRCWYLEGTLGYACGKGENGKDIASCHRCPVYRKCSGDEIQSLAESFDSMILSLNTHISELKDAERTLREQRHLRKTILDATPDFVCLQDHQSVFQAVNKAFCEILGRREENIVGKKDFDLFPEDIAEKNRQENLKVLKIGKPLEKQDEMQTAEGTKWFHVVKIPVRDPDGDVTGILWSGRDITELKEIQARLIESQKMESIGQLAAGIAHEINTPLGIILGYAQLLLEDVPESGDTYDDLKTIERQSKICRRIVSDLLRFSRHTESIVTSLDMNDSIEEVASVVEHTFKLDRVEIERDYYSNLPPIKGDREKLKQVFVNLLNNAYDAIDTDGTIRITTGFDHENDEIVISVADTGRGIPPEQIDRIFDPFFTTKPVGKGTGLGLSVTFGIIQEHGGRIGVKSPPLSARGGEGEDVRGTVFTIHLPMSKDRAPKEEIEETGDGENISVG
ncbi:MAG: PAS domain-containing protein [Desulfobacterales bacterium]|nr:PAS domain-containing protein [Desulfobacterales bacterium]